MNPRLFTLLYPALGFTLGVLGLQQIAANWLGRAGLANFLLINIVLPGLTLILAAFHRRPLAATLGGFLIVLGFVLGRLLARDWQFWNWTFAFIKAGTHPVEVAAAIGCAVIGGGVAAVARALVPRATDL